MTWPRSVRARLALWHGLALLVVVSLYAAAVLYQVRDDLYEALGTRVQAGQAQAVRDERFVREELTEFATALLLSIPFAVALSAGAGYLLARRALAPVAAMTARARRITADRLDERLPIDNPSDEFGRLAAVVNDALAKLERAFITLRRFTADASHELRTPLTAIRTVGEVGLREPRSEAEYRETIGSILEETERLTTLTDSLLVLARTDAGRADLRPARFDLAGLAREAVADLEVLAEEKRQRIAVEAAGGVLVIADRPTLRQAAINLLDNAIEHGLEGARIAVAVRRSEGDAVLEVIDDGPGIAAEHLPHLFERFYRADRARSRERGGAGLGLSIARWAVEVNGGRIDVESEVGRGSRFRIVVPAAGAVESEGLRAGRRDRDAEEK